MEIAEFFAKGGSVMYLLVICSVVVLAIGIERFRFYNFVSTGGEKFLQGLQDRLNHNDFDAALNFCREEKNIFAVIALSGMEAALHEKNIEFAMEIEYNEAALKLRRGLNYLSMLVTLAPLLGLLGTIFGMIDSFNIFNLQEGQPLAITGGIGEALTATATGLCVAIFALIVHTYLSQRLDEILTKFEEIILIVRKNLEEN